MHLYLSVSLLQTTSALLVPQVTAFMRSQYAKLPQHYPDIQFLFESEFVPVNTSATAAPQPAANASCFSAAIDNATRALEARQRANATVNGTAAGNATATAPATAPRCQDNSTARPLSYYNRILVRPAVLRPRSRGVLRINSTDPLRPPQIYPGYFSERRDLYVLIEALLVGARLSQTRALRRLGATLDVTPLPRCSSFVWGSFAYWQCAALQYTQSMYHPAGTCKMGPDYDPNAVVDAELRVRGVRGLRVVDASVMPFIVSAASSAPVVMIAEKAADMIKRRWLWLDNSTLVNATAANMTMMTMMNMTMMNMNMPMLNNTMLNMMNMTMLNTMNMTMLNKTMLDMMNMAMLNKTMLNMMNMTVMKMAMDMPAVPNRVPPKNVTGRTPNVGNMMPNLLGMMTPMPAGDKTAGENDTSKNEVKQPSMWWPFSNIPWDKLKIW